MGRGYHCAKFFKKRGDGVLGLDNFNPYYPVAGREVWLTWLKYCFVGYDILVKSWGLNEEKGRFWGAWGTFFLFGGFFFWFVLSTTKMG